MGAYNVANRASMAAGQPEDISPVLANFDLIAAVLNGGIDNSNINAAAAIAASKFAGYPADGAKVLKGDGTWGAAGSITELWDSGPLGADTATISTGNVLAGYSAYEIRWIGRSSSGAAQELLYCRPNAVATNTYNNQLLYGSAAAVTALEQLAVSGFQLGYIPGVATGGWGTGAAALVLNAIATGCSYSSKWQSFSNNSTGTGRSGTAGGFQSNITAITSMDFITSGNVKQNSRIVVLGVNPV